MGSHFVALFLAVYLLVFPASGQDVQRPSRLHITLVEGQGAINILKNGPERNFTVRVEERYGAPGKGIPVTFTLPGSGPSGFFNNGDRSVTVVTDDDGYAVARGFRPNNVAGQYNIRVSASAPEAPVTALIPQTNADADRGWPRRKLLIALLAAAAAGSGAIIAFSGN